MKKFIIGLIIVIAIGLAFYSIERSSAPLRQSGDAIVATSSNNPEIATVTTVAENLDTPWAIAFLPDKSILVTERKGTVRLVDSSGHLASAPVASITSAKEIGEGGLLGITLHPDFSSNQYVYLYYTYSGSGNNTLNRVVRMTYQNNQLNDEKIIVDNIPGAANHNGGRIKFGPDKYLYIATGDGQQPSRAQDKNSLAGKILRVTDTGAVVEGNPFGNQIYSYGHRNPQGLVWDSKNTLWATEHGPSGGSLGTGNDELNKIEIGKNYGWPEIQGSEAREGMVTPIINSGINTTWAPAGAAIIGNSLFFGGLRGQALYKLDITNPTSGATPYFKGKYGRIREVIVGPDNMLYITTSNKDGRGIPGLKDDKIIKINPQKL